MRVIEGRRQKRRKGKLSFKCLDSTNLTVRPQSNLAQESQVHGRELGKLRNEISLEEN